ncbi:hypothetical protein [Pontibacter litorisediminis]|uniref:hypothetical protein n=1 Tax=Pontibacter litorisediminis TaxID=1846260 RepID=UPI0023EB7420|nr:hypothetical protein [Pontibacter litorisediminis]
MAYADKLPLPALHFFRWFNAGCLLFTVVALLDVYVLPYKVYNEKIVSRQEIHYTGRSRYSNHSYTIQLDNEILYTEHFRYAYHKVQRFNPKEADSARLVTTRIFKIVKTAYLKANGVEKELRQGASIFGSFAFIPIAFGLIAIFGVAMWHNKEQLLNAAIMNMIVIIVQLWVLGYF